ncbi:MAG TPA: preprotein translocase subunit SecA [Candidatus Omnitrophota bacterium]|nr:preprotein translocase subunit SecA [Candidatus Omnitrophota bacterium]
MLKYIVKKILGTQNERRLKKLWPVVHAINGLESSVQALSDAALRAKTDEFRARLKDGATLDDILPEVFAVVREAGRRVLKMRHFDVQLLGGIILHKGIIAEMATGEGKTLVGTLPVYLNALPGDGVHVVTVNDYLARRDRQWMGPLYEFLGLTIGVIQHDMEYEDRKKAYACDITYGTNNEFGFDYLRDNMAVSLEGRVQGKLNYAIVDEVDSILIDEARTPLIISGPAEESTDKYVKARRAAMSMKGYRIAKEEVDPEWKEKMEEIKKSCDYVANEKAKTILLTEDGETKGAKAMGVESLHDLKTIDERHQIITALRAKEFFTLDVDYVIKEGKVIIVDEFTGRLMPGRRFSDGLHQALEAKENVKIERENQTLATITFQNYFRMYKKLAGMTGTAETEAVEFEKIYKLEVAVIPTNRPLIRRNDPDCIYRTEKEKFNAVVSEIVDLHKSGRPVLVGTTSIEKSERLHKMLERLNFPHTVLNAKYHEKEAEIVSRAGQESAITIATNMAGRGTDILLGSGVAEKGGLHVIGTERHEARRIDNQLRGRAGRQGDPGSSKFFLSLEDDLMRLFGSDRISGLMQKMGMEEGQEIQHPLVTKAIATAQKRVEGHNFEIRKHLLEYDDVMNRQREIIYDERKSVLEGKDLGRHFLDMAEDVIEIILSRNTDSIEQDPDQARETLLSEFRSKFGVSLEKLLAEITGLKDLEILKEDIFEEIGKAYAEKESRLGKELMLYLIQSVLLQIIDAKWKEHLRSLDELREGIHLRAYGQTDPLVEYKREAFEMFETMTDAIKEDAVDFIFKAEAVRQEKIHTVFDSIQQEFLHPEAGETSKSAFEQKQSSEASSPAGNVSPASGLLPKSGGSAVAQETYRRKEAKVGRNDPCPCGSGKKYKKCCGS